MSQFNPPSSDQLDQRHCLEGVDSVRRDTDTAAFKRQAHLHQTLWRERQGLRIGTQRMRPGGDGKERELGSRLRITEAYATGANLLDDRVRLAVDARIANPEPHQTINKDRVFCDLLLSMPMCFNLFSTLHDSPVGQRRGTSLGVFK